jgi:DDE superfamily endonuclease
VEEAGVHLALTRLDGRAPQGERVLGTVPQHDGQHSTRLGALGVDGLRAVMTVEGATDADVFRLSVKRVLGPPLAPGDMVVLDHRSAHNVRGVPQARARRGARLRYVPPDSPELSPMALGVSQLQTALRAAKARTREALEGAIRTAMETVTALAVYHWFRHCG